MLVMAEHRAAVDFYILIFSDSGQAIRWDTDVDTNNNNDTDGMVVSISTSAEHAGTAMTSSGPARYTGDILDDPDIVWMDDEWTAEEVQQAERKVLEKRGPPLSEFWKKKYHREARRSWDKFYKRNGQNFFKDRHYLGRVFPDLAENKADLELAKAMEAEAARGRIGRATRRTLLELGCGVGNAVFPLLEDNRGLYVIAVDLSAKGIEILKQHPMYSCGRCEALVLDASCDDLPPCVLESGGVDMVLLQFSLSAVAVGDMGRVASLAERALKPGGKLFLRDYGRYDEAQLRFGKGKCLGDNVYVRQDGTTSYFFSLEDVQLLFCGRALVPSKPENTVFGGYSNASAPAPTGASCVGVGASLIQEELFFVRRQYANRGQRVARRRVWVHGIFRKPL